MNILFIRHADAKNDKITKLGFWQCRLLSKQKEKLKFKAIYTSSANRCQTTAKYFNKNKKLEIFVEEGLIDRDYLDGKPETPEEQLWYDNYLNPKFSSKKPEGCKEYLKRTFDVFDRIVEKHIDKNENVVIVGHSCTFYALTAYLSGLVDGKVAWYRVGNASKVYLELDSRRMHARDIF